MGAVVALLVLTACAADRAETARETDGGANQQVIATEAASPDNQTSEANTDDSIEADVLVRGFAFDPGDLTVEQGQEVTWVNEDATAHPLVFSDGRNAALRGGTSTTIVFDEAGVFSYFCAVHSGMIGSVTVLAADGSEPEGPGESSPDVPTGGSSGGGYGGY